MPCLHTDLAPLLPLLPLLRRWVRAVRGHQRDLPAEMPRVRGLLPVRVDHRGLPHVHGPAQPRIQVILLLLLLLLGDDNDDDNDDNDGDDDDDGYDDG